MSLLSQGLFSPEKPVDWWSVGIGAAFGALGGGLISPKLPLSSQILRNTGLGAGGGAVDGLQSGIRAGQTGWDLVKHTMFSTVVGGAGSGLTSAASGLISKPAQQLYNNARSLFSRGTGNSTLPAPGTADILPAPATPEAPPVPSQPFPSSAADLPALDAPPQRLALEAAPTRPAIEAAPSRPALEPPRQQPAPSTNPAADLPPGWVINESGLAVPQSAAPHIQPPRPTLNGPITPGWTQNDSGLIVPGG